MTILHDRFFCYPEAVINHKILPFLLLKECARLDAALSRKCEQNMLRNLIQNNVVSEQIVVASQCDFLKWIAARGIILQNVFLRDSFSSEALLLLLNCVTYQELKSVRCTFYGETMEHLFYLHRKSFVYYIPSLLRAIRFQSHVSEQWTRTYIFHKIMLLVYKEFSVAKLSAVQIWRHEDLGFVNLARENIISRKMKPIINCILG